MLARFSLSFASYFRCCCCVVVVVVLVIVVVVVDVVVVAVVFVVVVVLIPPNAGVAQIAVLESGNIAEMGTYDELIARKSHFYNLVQVQIQFLI